MPALYKTDRLYGKGGPFLRAGYGSRPAKKAGNRRKKSVQYPFLMKVPAREYLRTIPSKPDRDWMGFRPSMPDSLPVIGPSRDGAEVIHAYGHGHVGLTLAPVTARMVADLVAGRAAAP
ncbi:MAG: FAD-dependent oxidoreductase, partial [Pseudorhodobacter sp.]